jgi:glycosyltransferase involved in cell wall biosynthesis
MVKSCLAWRLVDLRQADTVIATKFPSYMVPHRNKVIWLVHQLRGAYNLYETPYSGFQKTAKDTRLREYLIELDQQVFPEAKKIYTISKTVSARLKKFNGYDSTPLYPPLADSKEFHFSSMENFVLCVCRLEADKRVNLLIEAMPHVSRDFSAVIVGEGSLRKEWERLAERLGVADRIKFTGRIARNEVIDLYARAGVVFYGPIDEDYGYATIEAFSSGKPVITCPDSGGILEFVDDATGWIIPADGRQIAESIEIALSNKSEAKARGEMGHSRVRDLSWNSVCSALTES